MHNLQLTAGSLIGTRKMGFFKFRSFKKEVKALALSLPHEWSETHQGINSQWNGTKELSFKVSIFSDGAFELPYSFISKIDDLSVKYSQDAIALTIGESHLSNELTGREVN